MNVIVTLIVWSLASAPAPPIGGTLGPDDAVRIALENHPALVAAERSTEAARARRELARSGWRPRVGLSEEIVRSTNPVFVFASRLGQERFGEADFEIDALNRPDALTDSATRLSLQQNVWDAGRTRYGVRAAALGVEASELDGARTREEVAFGALEAFWNVELAERMAAAMADAERAAEENLRLAVELVDAGLGIPSDRLSAGVRLAEVRAMRIRAGQEAQVARAALGRALGLAGPAEFQLRAPEPESPARGEDPAALVAEALGSRADLASLGRRIRQAELGERSARSGRLPVIGAMTGYELHDERPFGTDGDNWTVGLSVRVPVYDGGETRARTATARAERERLAALHRALSDGVGLDVRAAWAARNAAAARVDVARAALEEAEEALRIVRERYGEGLAVMVELLGAEAALTGARAAHTRAVRDLAVSGAALDLAVGRGPRATGGS